MIHDLALRRALLEALDRDPRLDATHVRVAVSRGIVQLGGQVPSGDDLPAVRRAVRRVPGVRVVVDALAIAPPDAAARGDDDIARDVLHVLDAAPVEHPLQAEVREGSVTLHGTLGRQADRAAVESRVEAVAGVRTVSSLLGVSPSPAVRRD